MTLTAPSRPGTDEYVEYFGRYIGLVPEATALDALAAQHAELMPALRSLTESQAGHRYAPDKWSVRQVVGHLADGERVFAFRALWFARGETAPLPGFDENRFVDVAGFDGAPYAELLDGLERVRQASLDVFRGFDAAAWTRRGVANGASISVRALAFVIAGHGRHHLRILRERYFPEWPTLRSTR